MMILVSDACLACHEKLKMFANLLSFISFWSVVELDYFRCLEFEV